MNIVQPKSVFTRILEQEIPGVILFTTEHFGAILTNKPKVPGHTLLLPIREVATFSELNADELKEYGSVRQVLEDVLCKTYNLLRVPILTSGFEIPTHYHEHHIPVARGADVSIQGLSDVSIQDRLLEASKIRRNINGFDISNIRVG